VLLGATKLFLALCGTWLWLRELGASTGASRFGAVAFGFSFAMTTWLYHPATAVVCLWPWVFFAVELLADPLVSGRAFAALVFLLALWPLCGHLETAALGALIGGLWFGLRALLRGIAKPWAVFGKLSLAAAAALGLSAFSLLPQLHAVAASNRIVLANDPARFNFVPWVPYRPGWLGGFVTSLFPLAFGDLIESPMIPGAAGSIVEMGFGYIGVVGWSCALLVLRPGSRKGSKEWVLLALVVFGLGGAMGLPIFRTIVEALPGIRLLPPLRILLFVSAAGAPLAALEIDRLICDSSIARAVPRSLAATSLAVATLATVVFVALRPRHSAVGGVSAQTSALAWTLGILVLTGAAAVLRGRKILGTSAFVGILTGLAAVELGHQGMRLYSYASPGDLYPETPLIRFLRVQAPPYRIVGAGGALFPNTNVFALVENVGTHDPAERRDYVEFLDKAAGYPPFDYFKSIKNLNSPVLDFLNVRYLATPPGHPSPGSKWALVYEDSDGRVFENSAVLPRIFSPREIELVSPVPGSRVTNALTAFGKPLEDLLTTGAFSERALFLRDPVRPLAFRGGGRNGIAQIANFAEGTNRIRFSASVSDEMGGAIAVSSIVSDGGWSAEDENGNRLEVSLANGPFLGILLPAGDHRITLRYLPPGSRLGAAASVATLAALVAAVIASTQRASA
jgi:hypothetical protein